MTFYQIILSTKQVIEIDQTEFEKVINNLEKGRLVKVKQGIFNPSFVVSIIPVQRELETKIAGHIDESTGRFIATEYKEIEPRLEDEFDVRSVTVKNMS